MNHEAHEDGKIDPLRALHNAVVKKIKTTLKQIGMILFVSGFLAFIANSIHPYKIHWIHDWSVQADKRAGQ